MPWQKYPVNEVTKDIEFTIYHSLCIHCALYSTVYSQAQCHWAITDADGKLWRLVYDVVARQNAYPGCCGLSGLFFPFIMRSYYITRRSLSVIIIKLTRISSHFHITPNKLHTRNRKRSVCYQVSRIVINNLNILPSAN